MNAQIQEIAKKFNGRVVMDITGIEKGPALTTFMAILKTKVLTDFNLFYKDHYEINIIIAEAFQNYVQSSSDKS